ncbi:MAG: protein TolR [Candidatus Binatia bacterium]
MAFDHQHDDNISQINITPLVDVMLVLLVIFMVTAPILQQGVTVDLPQVSAQPIEGKTETAVVTVGKNGRIHLDNRVMTLDELQNRLRELVRQHPEQVVHLRADKEVPYGKVVEVMATLQNVGIAKLGMETQPLPEE